MFQGGVYRGQLVASSPWCACAPAFVFYMSVRVHPLNCRQLNTILSFSNINRRSDTARETEPGHRMKLFPSNRRTHFILYPFCTRQRKRNRDSSSYINTLPSSKPRHFFLFLKLFFPSIRGASVSGNVPGP